MAVAEISGGKLLVDGYVYVRSRTRGSRVYWDCQRTKRKECTGRAVTNDRAGDELVLYRGPTESPHQHAPNREETEAVRVTETLKRKAAEHPGQRPSQILRAELPTVSTAVLSQLPEREALAKSMRRERRKNMPKNPTSLLELVDVPARFKRTFLDEAFLLYDSRDHEDEDEDEDEPEAEDERERVLVFTTRRNIELLCHSGTWFLDGTFKESKDLQRNIKIIKTEMMYCTSCVLCHTISTYK